jgi:hypothetical protein
MKVALVCIAKNEDNYINEWINYYQKLGFDDIFIHSNDWKFNYDNPNVHISEYNGRNMQVKCYNECYNDIKKDYNWIAFFDVDEFLVLKKHKNIKEFLKNYVKYPAVSFNWYLFGDNGHKGPIDNEYSVLKRFTKRQWIMNKHVKTIVNTNFNHSHINVHNSNLHSVSPNFSQIIGPFNGDVSDDIAQLNHYFCKTKEEYAGKISRGRADHPTILRNYEEFDNHNFNDVEDFSAKNFMYN